MTREEARQLRPGDMVYVPKQTNNDWPVSYNRLFGGVYEVLRVDGSEVRITDKEGLECVLYYNEIEPATSRDLEDDFDLPDIKLLFGGDD